MTVEFCGGNTLAMEVRETFYTPAHYLGMWDSRLQWTKEPAEDPPPALVQAVATVDAPSTSTATTKKPMPMMPLGGQATQGQFDFDF